SESDGCVNGRAREDRQRGKHEIYKKDAGYDLRDSEAVVGRTLVEMRSVRPPDRFAPDDTAHQSDGSIGQIVERQDERGRQLAASGELEQQPSEQKADRQATDNAGKNVRDRLVERRKTQKRARECGGRKRRETDPHPP